ncbi:terpenoid cyclases/Protein prenyltransferase [Dendrothele bispora CBS 962.96]|uniref:Terpenoid cyclases/Protein prenyltransferase n=1 Tax=Dendrothele bispora (strain CBS 962.96) TaxID=1314807 RepID=A0A4S8ML91_DENBC|nr:terpenoid cyclases/Protein prenyltransferase [Dendrothele bispora CBS 962.96]
MSTSTAPNLDNNVDNDENNFALPRLARIGHAGHVKRCLSGLPDSQVDLDSSRLAIVFYCIGSLDLLGLIPDKIAQGDLDMWREWIWGQYVSGPYGSGFRPSPFMAFSTGGPSTSDPNSTDAPHIIMTYTALIALAILRDDFSRLDRRGLVNLLRSCQRPDGSFKTVPGDVDTESDLRTLYCAFVISSLLDNWEGVDVAKALEYVKGCRTYEGGYGISTGFEAQGGPTYIALASIYLAPPSPPASSPKYRLTREEKDKTISWLVRMQDPSGGFCGRTNKTADACYCFWCGAALKILGADHLVDSRALVTFLADCQFKYGGIAKAPGEHPDPYHTYLSLAALSMYPPPFSNANENNNASWIFEPLDPLINAKEETAKWAREKVRGLR